MHEPVAERAYLIENDDNAFENQFFGIYPNPVKSIAYLTYPLEMDGLGAVRVVDISGREVLQKSTLVSGGIKEFDFKNLKSGLYFIEVYMDKQVIETVKFIK